VAFFFSGTPPIHIRIAVTREIRYTDQEYNTQREKLLAFLLIQNTGVNGRTAKGPRCIVIAGPNGAGKTTFAREFLVHEAGVIHFVNADLLASGISPLRPDLAARRAGRMVLAELAQLARARQDFAFESTVSGRTYLRLLKRWKASGYRIEMVFLWLPSVQLALQRIAARVRQGGHDVPRTDVLRRFDRSWKNFRTLYRPLADTWSVYDNAGPTPRLLEEGP
jgi:predicted ABC-type ATPase